MAIGVLGAGVLVGCHKGAPGKAKEAAPNADSVTKSLAGLRSDLGDLEAKFSALRKQVEAVPPELPGFREVRAQFYEIEEGRGITDVRVTLLPSRLDAALSSGKGEDLRQIAKEIAETHGEIRQIDQLHVALLHRVLALERLARRR